MKFLILASTLLMSFGAFADDLDTQDLDDRDEPVFEVLLNVNGAARPIRCCGGHLAPRECPCLGAPAQTAEIKLMSHSTGGPQCKSDVSAGYICRKVEGNCKCYWHTTH